MLGDFDSQEYIALARDLFADGAEATLVRVSAEGYDTATLLSTGGTEERHDFKVIFVAPQQSTQIRFEKELDTEDYEENTVVSIDYRGEVDTLDKLITPAGEYTVTGVVGVKPLGVVIYQRLKLSR